VGFAEIFLMQQLSPPQEEGTTPAQNTPSQFVHSRYRDCRIYWANCCCMTIERRGSARSKQTLTV